MTSPYPLGNYGISLYGLDPYGSVAAPFGVAGATSYGPHFVQVRFTDLIDLSDAAFTTASNYTISPTIAVHSAIVESADSVVLQTDTQSFLTYTVTVGEAHSYIGIPMIPPLNTANFTGFPSIPGYFSVATTSTRVRCIFSGPMQANTALTLPSSYTVTDLNGNVLPVVSVQAEQSGNPLSVVLTLGVQMVTTSWYVTNLAPGIVDLFGARPAPPDYTFQWISPALNTSVPIPEFTGEVSGGQWGNPDGLVFFSPSLNVAASNSTIQVEEVAVCTYAYDTYVPPPLVDPSPFFIWSPQGPQTTIRETGIVLFAAFPRLVEATITLETEGAFQNDLMPPSFDGSCSIVMTAQFAPGFVPLLNNPAYWLFDQNPSHETTPPMWICANNTSGPIPPGSETTIVLHMAIVGDSTFSITDAQVNHWAVVSIAGQSSFSTAPVLPPTTIAANSFMRVARPAVHFGATCHIVGEATFESAGQPAGQNLSAEVEIDGYATVHVHVKQDWQASATIAGNSSIASHVQRQTHASVNALGAATVTATATKGPVGTVSVAGNSTLVAHATVNRGVSAGIAGNSTLVANPT